MLPTVTHTLYYYRSNFGRGEKYDTCLINWVALFKTPLIIASPFITHILYFPLQIKKYETALA